MYEELKNRLEDDLNFALNKKQFWEDKVFSLKKAIREIDDFLEKQTD